MEFMLILSEDPELVATEEQRAEAVQRVGEYAMDLVGDGTLKGGSPLRPVVEAKRVTSRDGTQRVLDGPFAESKAATGRSGSWTGRSPSPRRSSPGTSSSRRLISRRR